MGPQMTAHVAVVGISLAPRLSSVYLGHLPWKGRRPLPQWHPPSPDQVSPPEGVVITLLCVRHASLQGPPMSSTGTSPR